MAREQELHMVARGWGDPVHVDAAAFMALQGAGPGAVALRSVNVRGGFGTRAFLGLFQVNASNHCGWQRG